MKQIYLVWSYLKWGGAQVYFLSIVKQAGQDFKFTIVLPKESNPEIMRFFEPYGVEFEFLEKDSELKIAHTISQKIRRQWQRISSEMNVYRHFAQKDLSGKVVHIESAPWQSWIFLAMLARRGNVFVTMHNSIPFVSKWREFVWSRRLNFLLKLKKFHLFVANQNTKDELKKIVRQKFWDKITLTRASINPEEINQVLETEFDRARICKRHGIPPEKFIVLSVGQFIDRKGRWVFLEAARKIVENNSDIVFVWLMPELPGETETKKIKSFNLGTAFVPVKSADAGKNRAEILKFFRIADVFVLPSLLEGLPIALLEAQALGIPSVSTRINAIPEAIRQFETGILIEPGNSEELVEAVIKLKEDQNLRKKIGDVGRDYVLKNFDERHWAQVALENYRKVLES